MRTWAFKPTGRRNGGRAEAPWNQHQKVPGARIRRRHQAGASRAGDHRRAALGSRSGASGFSGGQVRERPTGFRRSLVAQSAHEASPKRPPDLRRLWRAHGHQWRLERQLLQVQRLQEAGHLPERSSVREDLACSKILGAVRETPRSPRNIVELRRLVIERLKALSRSRDHDLKQAQTRLAATETKISRLIEALTEGSAPPTSLSH